MGKYEIEIVDYGQGYMHQSILSSLTGLEFDEVDKVVRSIRRKRWGGQTFIKAFQALGFNTNPRFVKFDPETPYPCILRCSGQNKGYWYVFYYNDGIIYDGHMHSFALGDASKVRKYNNSYFLKRYGMKVTSMLEVGI